MVCVEVCGVMVVVVVVGCGDCGGVTCGVLWCAVICGVVCCGVLCVVKI